MKCNIREVAHLSDQPCVIEGRLNYKRVSTGSYRQQSVFKERWFRLINNYLFYFKISEMGNFDTKNPAGVFVMENSSIQMEHGQSIPFSFSISFIYYLDKCDLHCLKYTSYLIGWGSNNISETFHPHLEHKNDYYGDEPEKKHVFAARAEDNVVQWVMKLRMCSYEYLRSRLHTLQSKIFSITGKDPLLLVPRNEGACLWAPAAPFSTAPACSVNASSFSCHLHTNGAFTLERSKSDVQTHKLFRAECSAKTTFYTDDHKSQENVQDKETKSGFYIERSKTSNMVPGNGANESIFDNRPVYSRAAPSPPVRTKLSPNTRRVERHQDVMILTERSKHIGTTSILDEAPVPPRRKISPKNLDNVENNDTVRCHKSTDDLITF